ncbi:hypothetical protein FKM82_005243 [Ascaphus truei]
MGNITILTGFILIGFPSMPGFGIFFIFLLLAYICTIAGNVLILALFCSDQRLQTPMYFFLSNLAVLEICFSSNIIPNMLRGLLPEGNYISRPSCLFQMYTYVLLGAADIFLLTIMSFDRYLAICQPLHYSSVMQQKTCLQLMSGIWLGAIFYSSVPSILVIQLEFCSHVVDHFFCDMRPLLKISCSGTAKICIFEFAAITFLLVSSLVVTIVSYTYILLEIMKTSSAEGKKKTFSTCSSHALMVTLTYGAGIFMYARPSMGQILDSDKKVAILNTVFVPLLNPFIYTFRNKTVKEILKEK